MKDNCTGHLNYLVAQIHDVLICGNGFDVVPDWLVLVNQTLTAWLALACFGLIAILYGLYNFILSPKASYMRRKGVKQIKIGFLLIGVGLLVIFAIEELNYWLAVPYGG